MNIAAAAAAAAVSTEMIRKCVVVLAGMLWRTAIVKQ
jgi:hypothetical protein